ncbi:hypothetical protein [Pseudodesulfovibrio sp.]|uniref:VgrG-related protein n=1 Tax=Pseudodesulfovibrio sp. TaxID=2035812 RepID=UPI00260B9B8C|nr:hypothetical protein [Pseudodesulfovibrio sp.]MDD3312199.1 hypothetical protein [Pseudodesulfovibrio sp.]
MAGEPFVGDAMMYEALTTIARLMQAESQHDPQGPSGAKPANAPGPGVDAASAASSPAAPDLSGLGALSARFESGDEGVASVGYDRTGGTSYGVYQIASKPGTMDRFLDYLGKEAPGWADRLREAGPADTGSASGGMPAAWQAIAAENPERFGALQHDFISSETYAPARSMILEQTGLDFDNAPPALREVLWSTAVQHGPTGAARIFGKVIDRFVGAVSGGDFNSRLIEGVYDSRKGQFGSSTARVRQAVANRLDTEKQLALNLLGTRSLNRMV